MNKLPDEIATIIAQMGGRKIFAMAFDASTYDVSGTNPSLTLKIAKGLKTPGRLTHVKVTLDRGSDTYNVEFLQVGKYAATATKMGVYHGIYCDQLKSLVEEKTGLALSL